MRSERSPQPPGAASAFSVLLAMQLARARRSWRQYIIVSSAMPTGIAILLRAMTSHPDRALALQIISGNVVLSVAITAIAMLAQQVAWMRQNRTFDYYHTLPVPNAAVILAILVAYLLFALPGIAVVLTAGAIFYGVHLQFSLGLVPAILGTGVALSGIGALLGIASRDGELAGLTGNLVMMAVLFLGIIPPGRLPLPLIALSDILPSTYGVRLLLHLLAGTAGAAVWLVDGLMLLVFSIALFLAVERLSCRVG